MAVRLWDSASSNAFSTTLNGSLDSSQTTITLTSVTNLPTTGGIICIDRQDSAGNNTPTVREFISYTGISGSDLTGVVRGVAGSTAQAHSSGAVVEETFSVTHWGDLYDYLTAEHTLAGTHVMSAPSLTNARLITSVNASGASMIATDLTIQRYLNASGASLLLSDVRIDRLLNASGASLLGIPAVILWEIKSSLSGATTILRTPVPIHRAGQWRYANSIIRTVASGVSAIFDINKNGTSIFNDVGRLLINAGGTFASSASILTKGFNQGDKFSLDYDGQGGLIVDSIVMLVSE